MLQDTLFPAMREGNRRAEIEATLDGLNGALSSDAIGEDMDWLLKNGSESQMANFLEGVANRRVKRAELEAELETMGSDGIDYQTQWEEQVYEGLGKSISLENLSPEQAISYSRQAIEGIYDKLAEEAAEELEGQGVDRTEAIKEFGGGVIGIRLAGAEALFDADKIKTFTYEGHDRGTAEPNYRVWDKDTIDDWVNYHAMDYRFRPFALAEDGETPLTLAEVAKLPTGTRITPITQEPGQGMTEAGTVEISHLRLQTLMMKDIFTRSSEEFGKLNEVDQASAVKAILDSVGRPLNWDSASAKGGHDIFSDVSELFYRKEYELFGLLMEQAPPELASTDEETPADE